MANPSTTANHSWVHTVLQDLADYALSNDLPILELSVRQAHEKWSRSDEGVQAMALGQAAQSVANHDPQLFK